MPVGMRDLRNKGITFEDYDLPYVKTVNGVATQEGEKVAWFKDLDGNIIAIWQQTGTGGLRMNR